MIADHIDEASPDGSDRPLRADARRNRDALLEVATEAFVRGVDVPLEEIARRAGVGIGTLYRHFPNRDALVLAVYHQEVSALVAAAAELAAAEPPYQALAAWMERFVAHAMAKRGMSSALRSIAESSPDLFAGVRAEVLAAMGGLVVAAQADGAIRSDIAVDDVLRALGGICLATDADDWPDQARRLLRLVLDGLRFGAPAPAR